MIWAGDERGRDESEALYGGGDYWDAARGGGLALAQGKKVGEMCRSLGVSEQS
jgi:hypothetical protein